MIEKEVKQKEDWFAQSQEDVFSGVKSTQKGLTQSQVSKRHQTFGLNKITPSKTQSPITVFLSQFNQPLVYVLLLAVIVTAYLGEWVDSIVIFIVILINAIIGFFQEFKAVKAVNSLTQNLTHLATVFRDGSTYRIPVEELTIGDVVLLESGNQVPADIRLFEIKNFAVDESMLTGESIAVTKQTGVVFKNAVLAERTNMVFFSSFISRGSAKGVVVEIGDNTEIGKINTLIAKADILATPLTKSINKFSLVLLFVILTLSALTFTIGSIRGEPLLEIFLASVALAIGAIPEGLPAVVTITLAIGVSRMVKKNAIIRKLPAVETLGSTSIICSDKTGTLTKNQMTVQKIYTYESYSISGTGYTSQGQFTYNGDKIDPQKHISLKECLIAGILCNDSELIYKKNNWSIRGDPTEGALFVSAKKAGLDIDIYKKKYPRYNVIPFDSQNQYMATAHSIGNNHVIYLKGSVEQILRRCSKMISSQGTVSIQKDYIQKQAEMFASKGLRVLAFAKKNVPKSTHSLTQKQIDSQLVFIGLQAMLDPPREEVIESIKTCHTAGIGVKMITGDHELTAISIARKIGLVTQNDTQVLRGNQISKLSDSDLSQKVIKISVFARVSPQDKLRLVKAFQSHDYVVAMTGDGVNDAPSIRQANIGIAMGKNGSDVAKETADMILTDDNFSTIESAVEEGRGVYDNLLKFITWTLPTNFGEGLIILSAVFMGALLPILPLQLLWINMTTAICLGLMLAFEPKEKSIMNRQPRKSHEPLLGLTLLTRIIYVGSLLCFFAFICFKLALQYGTSIEVARTIAVNIFVFGELVYVFNCRSLHNSIFSIQFFSNPKLLYGVFAMIFIQIIFTYAPFFHLFFETAPLGFIAWGIIILCSILLFSIVEIEKRIVSYFLEK